MSSIAVEVDEVLHTAYIQLSHDAVDTTVEFNDEILIDLNVHGVAVGVEVLDERAPLPFAALCNQFHVHSQVVELLRLIRPDVSTWLRLTVGSDGSSVATAREVDALTTV